MPASVSCWDLARRVAASDGVDRLADERPRTTSMVSVPRAPRAGRRRPARHRTRPHAGRAQARWPSRWPRPPCAPRVRRASRFPGNDCSMPSHPLHVGGVPLVERPLPRLRRRPSAASARARAGTRARAAATDADRRRGVGRPGSGETNGIRQAKRRRRGAAGAGPASAAPARRSARRCRRGGCAGGGWPAAAGCPIADALEQQHRDQPSERVRADHLTHLTRGTARGDSCATSSQWRHARHRRSGRGCTREDRAVDRRR